MVKKVLLVVVILVAGFLGYAALQPPTFTVERSLEVGAPPDLVYDQIASFRNWREWSPWDDLDPNMTRTYEGPDSGEGAIYAWKGNDQVGTGKMEIREAVPGKRVVIALSFEEPFSSENTTRFELTPTANGTRVRWTMDGDKGGLIGKTMGIFMDFDKAVGRDFDKGLGKLALLAKRKAGEMKTAPAQAVPQAGEGETEDEGAKEPGAEPTEG